MIRLASVAVVAAALVLAFNPLQGQQPKAIGVGDACPTFNLPGIDGKDHSNAEYKKDVLVICITCNHCPMAVAYEGRMIEFAKKFGSKADFIAINVNGGEADRLPKMKERAAEQGFNFPYLFDESQAIARSLDAKVTPHFFVFNKERKLVYKGAMDNSQNVDNVKTRYLEDAVNAAAAGKAPSTATTRAVGCPVQYK